jgi:3-hydroxybutyryl-CoA dehydrogenase
MNVTIDLGSGDILVGVVGAGAMGRGIAQVAATGGCRVRLFDTRPGVAAEARDFIASMVDRAAEKGRMSAEDAAAARARLEVVEAVREFAGCNVVIEAVVEDVGVKRKVFAELEDTVSPETLLASNTSSLSVTSIAATCRNPERVAGMHFFNPAPLMRLVEVIAGARTDPAVTDALVALAERMGKVAVRVADAPGFLVNQVGRGYTIESAHIVSEGVASTFDIDRILRDLPPVLRRAPLSAVAADRAAPRGRTAGTQDEARLLRLHVGKPGRPGGAAARALRRTSGVDR